MASSSEWAAHVQLARLIDFGRTFHKRFGLVSFGAAEKLSKVEFVDVDPFDNTAVFKHLTGSPLRTLVVESMNGSSFSEIMPAALAGFWFNGHLLCDWKDPWRPRAAQALVDMFSTLSLPPCTLVINPRDFPWCKKDSSVPWTFVKAWLPPAFFGVPMQRPLSFYGGPAWSDVLMPLPEHWNVWADTEPLRSVERREMPIGVFRGTLTGRFLDARNVRVRLCELSKLHPSLLDARLSAGTNRRRVARVEGDVLHVEEAERQLSLLGPSLSQAEQAAFKVLVYAPGHVAASRLAWNLCSGSAVLMVRDPSCAAPDMWFTTPDFDARVARFVDGAFVSNASSIAFACDVEDVLVALDVLRLNPKLLETVTRSCVSWAEKTFAHEAVKAALRKACEAVA